MSGNLPDSPQAPTAEEAAEEQQQRAILLHQSFTGPLPSPDILAGYQNINPTFSERIMVLAEKQQSHRIKQEDRKGHAVSRDSLLGIISAFLISIVSIGLSTYLILKLNSIPAAIGGSVLSGSVILGIVSTFIKGTKKPQ
jgi:uncharacterized membrane protein